MLKSVSVVFLAVFLCAMPVQAMTADEFLSHKAENRDIAMFVLGNAEAGGVPELLRQAKEILGVAKTTPNAAMAENAKRAAFMHCAFASHLIRGLPKKEQSQYGNVLISTLAQTAEVLDMNQDEMLKTLRGVSGVFNDILSGAEEVSQKQIPPALFEKYLGKYTYLGDTCAGGLTFSKSGKTGYTMSVDNSCESGGTCGGDFEVVPSSERNGIVTLKDSEFGITFAVGSQGITVENVPAGVCGMGAYIQGNYVRGKKPQSAAKNAPAKANTDGGMLEKLKGSYLPDFPDNEGYQTVGDAFNAYFEDPKWELGENVSSGYGYVWHAVLFKGIAYIGERKAIFQASLSWAFNEKEKKLAFSKCSFMVNGTRVHPAEEGNILTTIMLNSKK